MSTVFEGYADYYDLFYEDKDYRAEADYVLTIAKKYGVSAGALLDIGCGSGNHLLHFINAGFNVTGVDLSDRLINQASAKISKIKGNAELIVGDARDFNIEKKFDLITSLFHVASYQTTNCDLEKYFRNISRHLAQNGIAIFDCWNGPGVLRSLPETRIKEVSTQKGPIWRLAQPTITPEKNLVSIDYKIFDISSENINTLKITAETHQMRYLFTPEIEKFVEQSGMQVLCVLGWQKQKLKLEDWYACYVLTLKS